MILSHDDGKTAELVISWVRDDGVSRGVLFFRLALHSCKHVNSAIRRAVGTAVRGHREIGQ